VNVAFYAPMKPPASPRPSGDRTIARLLCQAMRSAGASVTVASRFRSFMAQPETRLTAVIERRAERAVDRLSAKFERAQPDLWFTYHLFHKAPDLLGPVLCRRFGIPYIVAEASFAPKQASGPWAEGHRLVQKALESADHVFFLNRQDEPCVLPLLAKTATVSRLPPFLNVRPRIGEGLRHRLRQDLASRHQLDEAAAWLLTVGMMRSGDKTESYRQLAKAITMLPRPDVQVLIAGAGEAENDVRRLFHDAPVRPCFLGALSASDLRDVYAASDLYAWPAIGEAVGMATLEAMAAGLPVVTGPTGAVSDAIDDEVTGLLAREPAQMAEHIHRLLADDDLRRRLGTNAYNHAAVHHSMAAASALLSTEFQLILKRS